VAGPVVGPRTVAGPVGRAAPPQIGRGRRGCGCGGHHPPIRPGAAGVSPSRPARPPGLPDPVDIRRFRKGVHRPMFPSNSPSGEASFPWGESPRPSPPLAPRPPGSGISQGKPVRAFLAAIRQRVRAPQGVRGPPQQPFPIVLARSPPLPRHGFHWPLAGRCRLLCRELLPMANVASSSPPPELRGITRRGSPVRA
jgi:hypothetical protein